jgi:hypothetical protein
MLIGNFESFDELLHHFPPFLSAYQPSFYVEQKKDEVRFVPQDIDNGDAHATQKLSSALKEWLSSQAGQTDDAGQTVTMGESSVDILQKLKSGDATALKQVRRNNKTDDKYDPDNCDLIAWMVVS